MIIFPAIDIRNGKCVRLFQGKSEEETVYNDDPVFVAKEWEENGAKFLHVVDLDGAFSGKSQNLEIVRQIVNTVDIPVQLGGGIRTIEKAKEILEIGVERIIIGTSAIKEESFVEDLLNQYGDKIVVSIDAKDGLVCVDGWVNKSTINALDFAKRLEILGVKTIVYTDISKDGTMIGPNITELRILKENTNIDIIASGGIGKKEDVVELRKLDVYGVIIGKALYEKKIILNEVIST